MTYPQGPQAHGPQPQQFGPHSHGPSHLGFGAPPPQQFGGQIPTPGEHSRTPQAAGPSPVDHVRRLIGWGDNPPSPRERLTLQQAGIVEDSLQRLLVWRRSVLILIMPAALVTLGLSLATSIRGTVNDSEQFTGFGLFVNWLSLLSLLVLPIGIAVAIARWTQIRRSTRVLFGSWLVATTVPLVTALFPLSWIFDFESAVGSVLDEQGVRATREELEMATQTLTHSFSMYAVVFLAVMLLPVIIGLAGGVLRGARRIKGLYPAAVAPGWFVIVVAPFASIVMLTMFAVISPALGDGLLLVGVFVLASAPLVHVYYRRGYTRLSTPAEAAPFLFKTSTMTLALSGVGGLLVVVYAFTATPYGRSILGSGGDSDAWFSYLQAAEIAVSAFARYHVTSVVLCFFFATVVFREWREATSMSAHAKQTHDAEMRGLSVFDEDLSAAAFPQPTGRPAVPPAMVPAAPDRVQNPMPPNPMPPNPMPPNPMAPNPMPPNPMAPPRMPPDPNRGTQQ